MGRVGRSVWCRAAGALALLLVGATAAKAQVAPPAPQAPVQELDESCPGLIARRNLTMPAALAQGEVGLTFVGHSTFLIETPGGIRAATDYNDYVRPSLPLDAITMNRAHSTHYTDNPDPRIGQVLRGWNPAGGPARHDVTVGDLRVRSVSTNIRRWGYGTGEGGTDFDGNSIFVFEAGGLCIAHLGHLHHPLEPSHLRKVGRVDVVLVPVDGGYTLDVDGMMEVLAGLNAKLMIPMHYFGAYTLERFLDKARPRYDVARRDDPRLVLSKAMLPAKAQVLVLPGR